MNNLIDTLKASPLSINDLQNLCGPQKASQCIWIVYDDLQKYKNIKTLMKLGACVILLEIEKRNAPKVGHFIVLLDHGSHYEHFDSYGLTMDEEIGLTNEHHLTNIFRNSSKPIMDNVKRLQLVREDINTCGRWVVARLLLRYIELDAFLNIFKHLKPQTPDEMVTVLTALLPLKI